MSDDLFHSPIPEPDFSIGKTGQGRVMGNQYEGAVPSGLHQ